MKEIDIISVLMVIGTLVFVGGIILNSTWMFLLGFVCLCGTGLRDYYKTLYEYDPGDSGSDIE